MNTESVEIQVGGLAVQIVRKDIKNLHLGVYPPNGRVRVAAPLSVSDEAVRLAVIGKLGWIKKQQARFAAQPRQTEREMVSGESHYYLGRRYRLRVVERDGPSRVMLRTEPHLKFRCVVTTRLRNVSGCCGAGIVSACANLCRPSWPNGKRFWAFTQPR